MKRVFLITNIPTPYRVPLFNILNDIMTANGYELTLVFSSLTNKRRKWDIRKEDFHFEFISLNDITLKLSEEKIVPLFWGLFKLLMKTKPDIVISAGFGMSGIITILYSLLTSSRIIFWSGEISLENEFKRISLVRRLTRRIMVKYFNAFLAYGTLAKEYLVEHLKVKKEEVFIAQNTVETEFFSNKKRLFQKSSYASGCLNIVTVGYLTERKNIFSLIKAVEKILVSHPDMLHLTIVGDGSQKKALISYCDQKGIIKYVNFTGNLARGDVAKELCMADIFLFPSLYDIYGLVVIEAMACGLPVISSMCAGVTKDAIIDGKNGFRADFRNVDEIANKIEFFIENPKYVERFGEYSKEMAMKRFSLKNCADGFIDVLNYVSK